MKGRLEFPWWYFGTDGVTALDPSDENQTGRNLSLMSYFQRGNKESHNRVELSLKSLKTQGLVVSFGPLLPFYNRV